MFTASVGFCEESQNSIFRKEVISSDINRLVQFRSNQSVEFILISSNEALQKTRKFLDMKEKYLQKISISRGTLEQRLMSENLIGGVEFNS